MNPRRLATVVMLLVLLGCRHRELTSGEGYEAAAKKAHEWLACDQRDDPACAVALMHIPPIYEGDALEKERQIMIRGVRLLRDRFGGITAFGPPATEVRMAAISWASGTDEYWRKCRRSSTATFPVVFSKLSSGYLKTEVCDIDGTWQMKAVHYGLPLSNPSSAPMIEMIDRELGGAATTAKR